MRVLVLVVNYKLNVFYSKTLKSISTLPYEIKKNIDVFVWDNIPYKENENLISKMLSDVPHHYSPSDDNVSLSRIYNIVINSLGDAYELLIIFDNDTFVTDLYFDKLLKEANNNTLINLFLPQVRFKSKLVSPAKLLFCKGYHCEKFNLGPNLANSVTAINSGMAIRVGYLKTSGFKYNEKNHFYGTDDDFMLNYCRFQNSFFMLDYVLEHSLSKYNEEEIKIKVWRFDDQINGLVNNFSDNLIKSFIVRVYVSYLKLKFKFRNKLWPGF